MHYKTATNCSSKGTVTCFLGFLHYALSSCVHWLLLELAARSGLESRFPLATKAQQGHQECTQGTHQWSSHSRCKEIVCTQASAGLAKLASVITYGESSS
jgi:hypothetical protein